MILALLAVAALAWWLHGKGELMPALKRWGGVAALALLGVRFLETGRLVPAALAGVGAAFWWYAAKAKASSAAGEADALAVLGLADATDADAVHAAWRRTLATAHPDAGGDAAAVQRATAARDLLLARLRRR